MELLPFQEHIVDIRNILCILCFVFCIFQEHPVDNLVGSGHLETARWKIFPSHSEENIKLNHQV